MGGAAGPLLKGGRGGGGGGGGIPPAVGGDGGGSEGCSLELGFPSVVSEVGTDVCLNMPLPP